MQNHYTRREGLNEPRALSTIAPSTDESHEVPEVDLCQTPDMHPWIHACMDGQLLKDHICQRASHRPKNINKLSNKNC